MYRIFKYLIILLAGNVSLFASSIIIATTTDIDPKLAQGIYEVGMGIYDGASEGDTVKIMTATGQPSLEFSQVKKKHPSKTLERNAREAFKKSLVKVIGQALRANKDRDVAGHVDTPRLIRELRNHVGDEQTTIVIVGSTLWTGGVDFSFINLNQTEQDLRLRRPSHGSVFVNKFLSPFSMEEVTDLPNCRVIWFDPTGDVQTCDDAYKSEVANFWNCMFSAVSIPMAAVQSNSATTVQMALSQNLEIIDPKLNKLEEGARMLTIAEMRPNQIFYTVAIPFTHLWLADLSPSQSGARESMARRLSDTRGVSGQYHGLFVFESGDGVLYSENSDVLELAAAFRQVQSKGGVDSAGSFSATLKKVRDVLRARNSRNCSINILSDVAPIINSSIPESERYTAILQDIISDGHNVTFVRTNPSLDVRGFLPRELNITVTEL